MLGRSDVEANVFDCGTITVDMFGYAFYRQFKYKMVTHARVFSLSPQHPLTTRQGLFVECSMRFLRHKFGYENMCSFEKIKNEKIFLPQNNGSIDFDFMEHYIAELEAERIAELEAERIAELEAYLTATGFKDYTLTEEERRVVDNYNNLKWGTYNLKYLFGKSTRGKRLKSADRIPGDLPFVTAGEANEGISDFIGNKVKIFDKNTTTIDMFGSAKYRNYKYGGDDHIAVVHTEKIPKMAAIFITAAIHKSSHSGRFDYSKNFYAKDADELDILLPIHRGNPDYKVMEILISAIQKLVIKDVVTYADKKIAAMKKIIKKR